MKKISSLIIIGITALSIFSGCGQSHSQSASEAPLPDEAVNKDNEKVRIVFEYQIGHIQADFEEKLESMFDVDIIMNMNTSSNAYLRLKEELTHDMAPDLVLCEYIKLISDDIFSRYFYDLSAENFVSNYYLSAIEACTSSDGGLYYLPGPSYVYGIVYDKTAFAELGLSVPSNYSEFAEIIRTVDSLGLTGLEPDPDDPDKLIEVPVRAFVPTMKWPDMFQILFNTMNYESSLRGVTNAKWLSDYQKGGTCMVGHMEPAAEKYLKLFDDGVLSADLWDVKAPYRSQKLYQYHTSLMTIECQQGYEYNYTFNSDSPDNLHEMGMMPIFTSDAPDSGYLYAIPRSYFGITKQGAMDPRKLDMLLNIVNYLSTPDGQMLLINGSDYFGFLKDDISLGSDFYSEVTDTIKAGRIISSFYYEGDSKGNAVEAYLHASTPDLVNGNISVREWLSEADNQRDIALTENAPEVFGTVTDTLLPIQTAYIDGLAYLNAVDADIAFVPIASNYGTEAYFFSGDITEEKIAFISPEKSFVPNPVEGEMNLVVAEMTGRELLDLACSSSPDGSAAFAGVDMVYSLSGSNGAQYVSLMIGGKAMDMSATYRVAALRGAVSDANIIAQYPELNFCDIMKSYIENVTDGTVSAPPQLIISD